MSLRNAAPAGSTLTRSALSVLLLAALAACGSSRVAGTSGAEPGGPADQADQPGQGQVQPRYLLRDNGVRCVRAPCFSIDVIPLGAAGQKEVLSDVDFSALDLASDEEANLQAALQSPEGLTVEGRIEPSRDPEGRVFRVTRLPRDRQAAER